MKNFVFSILILPAILLSREVDGEIALILKNEESCLLNNESLQKKDFVRISHKLFENQKHNLGEFIKQMKDEIVEELSHISNINNNKLKNKIASLLKNSNIKDDARKREFNAEANLSVINNMNPSGKTNPSELVYKKPQYDSCPEVSEKAKHFSLGVEFLYWQALSAGNLEYAFVKDFPVYQTNLVGESTIADGLAGEVASASFNWKPGVRACFSYETALDSFELFAEYTYYNTHGENSITASPIANTTQTNQVAIKSVFPTNFTSALIIPAKANSKIRLNYQLGDLMLAKHLAASQNFSLDIKGGLEGAWLDQHWKVSISDSSNQSAITSLMWRFWGIGPGIGVDCNWHFTKQFSLFIDLAASLLYGHHKDSLVTKCSSGNINNLYQNIHPTGGRVAPHGKLSLGFYWDCEWKDCLFKLFAAYEINSWANIAEIYQFHDIGLSGSQVFADALYSVKSYLFNIQGVNIGINFSF
jgi:hypothetical protein